MRFNLDLTGTKYAGIGACGAFTLHVDAVAVYSCLRPTSTVAGMPVITIEGLSPDGQHPLQRHGTPYQ